MSTKLDIVNLASLLAGILLKWQSYLICIPLLIIDLLSRQNRNLGIKFYCNYFQKKNLLFLELYSMYKGFTLFSTYKEEERFKKSINDLINNGISKFIIANLKLANYELNMYSGIKY